MHRGLEHLRGIIDAPNDNLGRARADQSNHGVHRRRSDRDVRDDGREQRTKRCQRVGVARGNPVTAGARIYDRDVTATVPKVGEERVPGRDVRYAVRRRERTMDLRQRLR